MKTIRLETEISDPVADELTKNPKARENFELVLSAVLVKGTGIALYEGLPEAAIIMLGAFGENHPRLRIITE